MIDHDSILGPSSSPATDQITAALAKAQSEYTLIKLDSANPHFKSKFASYSLCCDALRKPLNSNGIALPDFRPGLVGGQWVVVGTLRHNSGQYIQGMAPLVNPKGDMQGFGAAMTYAKRTLLMALTGGFSGEADDDGESVTTKSAQTGKPDAIAFEQSAKTAIKNAATEEEARKHLNTVRLRVKEKTYTPDVFRRVEAEFNNVWKKEAV